MEHCLAALTHVDGVMIGRAAYHEPYRLHLIHAALFGTPVLPRRDLLMRLRALRARATARRGVALKHISKALLGLFHAQPGGRLFRQVLSEEAPRRRPIGR